MLRLLEFVFNFIVILLRFDKTIAFHRKLAIHTYYQEL